MDTNLALHIGQQAATTALTVAAPVLAVALALGLLTAIFQAVTSIRDMTLGLILKLVGVGITVLIFGGWMMQVTVRFTIGILNQMQAMGQ